MNFPANTAAEYAAQKLDALLERTQRDTQEALERNDIPTAVTHFSQFQDTVKDLQVRMTALQKHLDLLSHELLPTMFKNQDVQNIHVKSVGTVTVNDRWSCKVLKRAEAHAWLRETGNGGLITETVNAQTLGAFARTESAEGRPLPSEIFDAKSSPYISIK